MSRIKLSFLVATILTLLLLAFTVDAQSSADVVFDLEAYGNIVPGTDITTALANAWKDACASGRSSAIVIPGGTFEVREGNFAGPCKNRIDFQLGGTLRAPKALPGDNWIIFAHIDRLTVSGGGVFDGQGKEAWGKNDCHKRINCAQLPVSLRFNFITNSIVTRITSLDSKNFHINVLGCNNLTFHNINIIAPGNSPNTDGIHIGRSNKITITKSKIATGDDCISLGDGSRQIEVANVTCGPGHGISVGSLGRYTNEEPVEGVLVKNCTMINTTNGVRIKTWPGSAAGGTATDMHFLDIIMVNVGNPILIDQEYCPWNQCNRQVPSKIKISKVSFENIRGSSATPVAIKLICSRSFPCEEVKFRDIDLTPNGITGPITSQCTNVRPIVSGKQNPKICASPYQPPLNSFTVDAQSSADVVFDLEAYGNIVPGTDITTALANAWKDACASGRSSAIVIPGGTFEVREGKFAGPCKNRIDFQLGGTLRAPKTLPGDNWITFAQGKE
ncbi:exopolygalacturonase-like [Cucurbita moschata]|uniref:Exopolygalacturonase-like n=1 Tax=Cucurbita moschata TaxID=3662 RepID=A0A6J1EXI6_CUCMO|nr:exopolygalacturonase-like [Cucurbita moschata]